jgi:hypothetical protein
MKGMPSVTAFLLPYSRFPSFLIFLIFFVNNDLVQFFVSSFGEFLVEREMVYYLTVCLETACNFRFIAVKGLLRIIIA